VIRDRYCFEAKIRFRMWDGQRALKLIRYRAKDFGIDSNRLGVFGFSAGGRGRLISPIGERASLCRTGFEKVLLLFS
jgi:hypothetical protein